MAVEPWLSSARTEPLRPDARSPVTGQKGEGARTGLAQGLTMATRILPRLLSGFGVAGLAWLGFRLASLRLSAGFRLAFGWISAAA